LIRLVSVEPTHQQYSCMCMWYAFGMP